MVNFELGSMRAGIFGLLLLVCARLPSYAHEPLFGVGPHTVYQHGLGLESEIEFADESISLHNEVLYGLTTNLAYDRGSSLDLAGARG